MQHTPILPLAPIPARVVPCLWEDLASYITRVAAEMGYKNPGWILHPEGVATTVQPYNLCIMRRKANYQFFERLLCLNEGTIFGLTLHRFALRLLEPAVSRPTLSEEVQRPLLTRNIFQTFFHPHSATKVCPACLAEEPAHGRLYWSVLPVIVCLRHRVFLIDRCPACQCPIPLLRPSLLRCPRCQKGDYRQASAVHMPEDPFSCMGQALILHNLGIKNTIHNTEAADKWISPLLELLPWQYFLLLDAFRCILGPLFPDAPFLRVSDNARVLLRRRPNPQNELSVLEWSVIIETVHSLCTSWPDNFFSFLDAFPLARSERRSKRNQQRATGLQRDFGPFYEKWLYKRLTYPAFDFLHEAFETYLRKHYTGGGVTKRLQPFKKGTEEQLQQRSYLTKKEVKVILGIGEDVLQTLLTQGVLQCVKKPLGLAGKRTMFLIDRESVEVVRKEWAELLPLDVVVRSCLGVTKGVLLGLEQAGMLMAARGPSVDGYKLRLYRRVAIAQFEETLSSHALKAFESPLETMISLPVFASKVGISLITLLEEVLEDRLVPVVISGNRPFLRRLMVPPAEMTCFLEEYKQRQREKQELLTPTEVALNLGISKPLLRRWARLGLIKGERLSIAGKKPSLLFRKQALEEFRHTYAFTEEVAELLGVNPRMVSTYVGKGKLHPVVGRKLRGGGTRLLYLLEEVLSLTAHSDAEDEGVNSCKEVF